MVLGTGMVDGMEASYARLDVLLRDLAGDHESDEIGLASVTRPAPARQEAALISRSPQTAEHETLVFERRLRAPPHAVFAAFVDVDVRARWSAPSPTARVSYSSADFTVGGEDRFRCGAADDLRFAGHVRYLDIQASRRIVYSELISTSDVRLSASLVTWELESHGTGTRLVVTAQVTSWVGRDMIDGSRAGMNGALDNLVEVVEEDAGR